MTEPQHDLIRTYLLDGPEELPERAYVAMRGAIERVPQRGRRPWASFDWHLDDRRLRLALVAAVVAAALFATWRLLPNPNIDGPGATRHPAHNSQSPRSPATP